MGNVRLEIGRQVDDIDRTEWALLRTDTASNAQGLGDEGNLGLGSNFDTKASTADNGARFLAFLSTFLYHNFSIGVMFVWAFEGVPLACTVSFDFLLAFEFISRRGMVGLLFSHLVRTNDSNTVQKSSVMAYNLAVYPQIRDTHIDFMTYRVSLSDIFAAGCSQSRKFVHQGNFMSPWSLSHRSSGANQARANDCGSLADLK